MVGAVIVITLTISWSTYHPKHTADVKCDERLSAQKGDLVFFVVGDWGRNNDNQMRAVKLMDEVAGCLRPSTIISTGDNIYPNGLISRDDPQFMDKFACPYSTAFCDSKSLGLNSTNLRGIPWHAVLGNHDYGDTTPVEYTDRCDGKMKGRTVDDCDPECCASPHHQMSEHNPRLDSGVWDLRSTTHLLSLSKDLDLILIDTNPFISRYKEASWANLIGGISSQNTTLIKEQVEAALSASKAKLKFLVGHSPIISRGEHCPQGGGDCAETSSWLSPLIQKYKVHVYLSGHDHDLQHTLEDGVHYVVSGAGSDVRLGEFDPEDGNFWGRDDQGFVAVRVRDGRASLMFFTATEGLAYQVEVQV